MKIKKKPDIIIFLFILCVGFGFIYGITKFAHEKVLSSPWKLSEPCHINGLTCAISKTGQVFATIPETCIVEKTDVIALSCNCDPRLTLDCISKYNASIMEAIWMKG